MTPLELDNFIQGLSDHLAKLTLGNPSEPLLPQKELRQLIATAAAGYALASSRFGGFINAFAELNQSDQDRCYIAAAQEEAREGELEIDDCAVVSQGSEGAYVMAWLWVSNDDAGIEPADEDPGEEPLETSS
jgi:hypothetical protein